MLFSILFLEFFTVTISLVYYKKTTGVYRYFILFLIYVLTTEVSSYILKTYLVVSNHLLHNVLILVSFLFYFIFYKNIFKNKRLIKTMNVFVGLFIMFYLIEFFYRKTDVLSKLFNYSFVFGSILLVITLILFLIEIINDEKIVLKIKKTLIFWISIGLLLFHIGTIPIFIALEYLDYNFLHQYILLGLNIIMYSCFTIGFILSDKKYNY